MKPKFKFGKTGTAAILGCGPSGLFAAHALVEKGWDVMIFSKKRRSEMFGAQYLHKPIPGLSDGEPRTINYRLNGTAAEYREKVYGRRSGITVSPEEYQGQHLAWDIRQAYYDAWSLYVDRIVHLEDITNEHVWSLAESKEFDRVISTIPAPNLCGDDRHVFDSQTVWAVGDAPERGIFCPVPVAPFEVICDGTRDTGWYRAANVFGYKTAEWMGERKPPIEGVARIEKPISTDCNCMPGVLRLGRYGEWRKGVLAHDAYTKAVQL